jgi:N-formylglutamate amidohydrolase
VVAAGAPEATSDFEIVRARAPGPIVVEIPHAGLVVDERAAPFVHLPKKALEAGALVEDADLGADLPWEGTELAGVTRVVARASRYVIDLNTNPRPPPRPPFYEKEPEPRAFIRRSHCGMNWRQEAIPKAEIERRISEVLEPYHRAIDVELERARALHGAACLVSSHTFHDRKRAVADVVLGTQNGAAARAALRDAVADVAREVGLSVALEEPFRGGWSLTRHARPAEGIEALQIEIARRLVTGNDGELGAPVDPAAVARLRAFASAVASAIATALGT